VSELPEDGWADHLPGWLRSLAVRAQDVRPEDLSPFLPPEEGGRGAAVLILFGDDGRGWDGADVLLIERAHDMRSHAGQVAFPGGAVDPDDAGEVAAALREATEETGLDPDGVRVLATLPPSFLPPSGFVVTPVLAWWRDPSPVSVVDTAEVASVHRVPLAELLDPANRYRVSHPSGFVGPAFDVAGLFVWGFTAGLLDRLLRLAGWEQPWDAADVREMPDWALDPTLLRRTGDARP
jgi:8-oxo-dGTP pyrophosphatase MutT (NUDIX family)